MKKTIVIIFLMLLVPFSFFIVGCCKNQNFKITGVGRFFAYETEKWEEIEIIRRKAFELRFYPNIDFIGQNYSLNTSSLYAMSCQSYMKNCIKAGTVQLVLNKEIKLLSKRIPANTNLISKLDLVYTAYNTECSETADYNGQVDVRFSKELMNVIEIENGLAKFKISYETNDGKLIEAEKEVSINL